VLDVLDAVLLAGQRQQHQEQQTHSSSTMGFCLVRPPGHHVLRSRPMGFGLVNLVSMAAAAALQHPGIDKVWA
jgi:acetoin utilization deacetylase AcuC-like enzyme